MDVFLNCLVDAFAAQNLLMVTGGTLLGIICGAIPGLTATMSIALILPMTYVLEPSLGMAMILGVYVGATYGGSISAILINVPGTPASMMTGQDGYPLAHSGRAGTALGVATVASFFGGILSGLVLIFVAPRLGAVTLQFGPAEYFAVGIFALSLIAGLVGDNIYKGIAAGLIGVAFTMVGSDPITAASRYTFGNVSMTGGLQLVPTLVGLFGFREILNQSESAFKEFIFVKQMNSVLPTGKEVRRIVPTSIRCGIIGTFVGILPGAGGPIASFLAYDTEKRMVDKDGTFGTGDIRGIAASESANNGTNGGALIPLLTLGVPGDGATAVMMGAFMMHNITPGPMLFVNQGDLVNSIYANYMLAAVLMLVIGLIGARLFMQVIKVPTRVLVAAVALLCFVGSYAVRRSLFDVGTMMFMGVLGYILEKRKFPVIATVLGFVLGALVEANFRSAVVLGKGNVLFVFTKPISCTILIMTIMMLFWPAVKSMLKKRKASTR